MATPNANPAINTFLQLPSAASPEVFTTVANVSSIAGFSMSAQVVDVTSHSNADAWRRKIVTLIDAGILSMTIYFIFNDAGHQRLLSTFVNRGLPEIPNTPFDMQLSIPTPGGRTVVSFSAQMSKFNADFPVDNVVKAMVDFIVIGQPRFPGVNE